MDYAIIAVVLIALFGDYLLLTVIVPFIPDLFPSASKLQVSFLFASKAIVQIVTVPFVGHFADVVVGPQKCMAGGLLVLTASTALWAYAGGYWPSVAARGVQGLASSLTMAGGMSLLAKVHGASERGRAVGLASCGVGAGVLVGPTLGGILYSRTGREGTFLSLAGLLGIDLIAQLTLWYKGAGEVENKDLLTPLVQGGDQNDVQSTLSTDDQARSETTGDDYGLVQPTTSTVADAAITAQSQTSKSDSFLLVAKDPYVVIIFTVIAVSSSVIAMLEPTIPALLNEEFDMGTEARGLSWLVVPLSSLIATPIAGYLADRVPRYKIASVALFLYGTTLPFGAQFGPLLPLLLTTVGIAGAAAAFADTAFMPLLADIMECRGLDRFGTVFAVADGARSLGFVMGPILGEALSSAIELRWVFLIFGVMVLMCAPLPLLLAKVEAPKKSNQANPEESPATDPESKASEDLHAGTAKNTALVRIILEGNV